MPLLVEQMEDQGIVKKFHEVTGQPLGKFCDKVSTATCMNFKIDVIAFANYCQTHHGYNESSDSLFEFVKKTFGNDICELIITLF